MLLHKGFQSIVSRIYGEKKFGIGDMHEMISDNDKSLYFRVITLVKFLDSLFVGFDFLVSSVSL